MLRARSGRGEWGSGGTVNARDIHASLREWAFDSKAPAQLARGETGRFRQGGRLVAITRLRYSTYTILVSLGGYGSRSSQMVGWRHALLTAADELDDMERLESERRRRSA